jgi:hypothetical protein
MAAVVGCSSGNPTRRIVDAAPAGSGGTGGSAGTGGGNGGTGGTAGLDAAAGTGGTGQVDATPDRTAADAGPPIPCAVTVTQNTYDMTLPGCGGVAMCRGVIAYVNNSPVTLTYPTIRFTIPAGVACLRSHSASRWIISDDGATSHQCVFTTNLLAAPWNVAPNGTFRFGYDVTDGVMPALPTDFAIGDGACPIPDGGLDGPAGVNDAALDGTLDAQVDQRDGLPADARDAAGN